MKKSFEDALKELEEVVQQLEGGETTLEESLKLFELGVSLARHCATKLDESEAKINILLEKNGQFLQEPFELERNGD